MSVYIIPVFVCAVLLIAACKKINVYKAFVKGAKDAVDLVISLIPFIATILIAIELFKHSGLLELFCNLLSPVFSLFGIPKQLISLIIIKPFSASGATAILNNIIATFGANSYLARVGAVIAASSDTVFYISAVYFSKTKIKKLGTAIPIALLCTFIGAIVASLICLVI